MEAVSADILIINTNAPIKNRGKKMVKNEEVKLEDKYLEILILVLLAIDNQFN